MQIYVWWGVGPEQAILDLERHQNLVRQKAVLLALVAQAAWNRKGNSEGAKEQSLNRLLFCDKGSAGRLCFPEFLFTGLLQFDISLFKEHLKI